MMIVKAFLINKDTICIYSKIIGDEIYNEPQLISGFLSAVSALVQDISKDEMKSLIMGKSKILYQLVDESNNVTMIIIVDSRINDTDLMENIEHLTESFRDMFSPAEIKAHMHDMNYFLSFDKNVNNIIKKMNGFIAEEIFDEKKLFPDEIKPIIDLENRSIQFLFKLIKNDLGKIIYSLFLGKRVVITGDKAMIKLMIDSLEIFAPHRNLKKIYWADDISEIFGDIVGVDRKIAKLLIDSTIIDLDKNKVFGMNRNKYFDDLITELIDIKPEKASIIITEKIKFLLEEIKNCASLINNKEITDEIIEKYAPNITPDILEIIENFLKLNYRKSSEKIHIFCENIRKRTSRIVMGFKKKKW